MSFTLKCVCVICKTQYATKECEYDPGEFDITHGLCPIHSKEENDKLDKLIAQEEKNKL